MTHLHVPVPAITRGKLARTHELKISRGGRRAPRAPLLELPLCGHVTGRSCAEYSVWGTIMYCGLRPTTTTLDI